MSAARTTERDVLPIRKSLRLADYDYSQAGGYFITLCTLHRYCLFGRVVDGEMKLNPFGEIVHNEWQRTATLRPHVRLDSFVVMPNHFHAILAIDYPALGYRQADEPRQNLERIVAGFKGACTSQVKRWRKTTDSLWQRSFFDQIIRNTRHHQRLQWYIANNPLRWEFDKENPERIIRPMQPHGPTDPVIVGGNGDG